MSKKQLLTVSLILLLIAIIWVIRGNQGNKGGLANPGTKQVENQSVVKPLTSAYNPPKEIKYDSSTDLKKELDSVNPQILDSDFGGL